MPDGSIQEEVNNRVYELTLEHRATQSEFLCECVDAPCSAFVSLTLDQDRVITRSRGELAALTGSDRV